MIRRRLTLALVVFCSCATGFAARTPQPHVSGARVVNVGLELEPAMRDGFYPAFPEAVYLGGEPLNVFRLVHWRTTLREGFENGFPGAEGQSPEGPALALRLRRAELSFKQKELNARDQVVSVAAQVDYLGELTDSTGKVLRRWEGRAQSQETAEQFGELTGLAADAVERMYEAIGKDLAAVANAVGAAAPAPGGPPLELVESVPAETTLGHADLPKAADVWLEMVASAAHSLDFGEFYAVNHPGSRLDAVVKAIEAAAARGVKVRFLVDAGFLKKEPETFAQLKASGISVVALDWAGKVGGGVQHAKYFLVDGREAYLGSQNFDWRSLEHIQELGLRIRIPAVVSALARIFESDWVRGGGESAVATPAPLVRFPISVETADGPIQVAFEASPESALPDKDLWGLPKLVEVIDSAKTSVRVQLLTYKPLANGVYFDTLDSALKRAAARGVQVQLLVADWSKRTGTLEGLQSLALVPGIAVKFMDIPAFSGGFIPFARVAHAKYLVVDGRRAWVGTSNWERDYFFQSRNVGLFVDGAAFAARLDLFFQGNWSSPYAEALELGKHYEPPRVAP